MNEAGMSAVNKPYEAFEHTADVGLEAYGGSLEELFVNAARGMQSLMVPPEQVRAITKRAMSVEGHDEVSLLIAWLNHHIFLFDTEYLLLRDFHIAKITTTNLTAEVIGEQYDAERHELSSAIKAVTWHEAAVERTESGYKARIIFDI